MKLVQTQMFDEPVVVADYSPKQVAEPSQPFDMDAWGKSIGGLWEQVKAQAAGNEKGAQ